MKRYDKLPNPAFVLEEEKIIRNVNILNDFKQKTKVQLLMALKGFANWKAFGLFRDLIDGASASSYNEAKLAYDYLSNNIHLYSPVYHYDELEKMVRFSSHITFNSLGQLTRFVNDVKKINENISVGLRVNPEYSDVETDLYNPASSSSRLGISAKYFPERLPDYVEGLHFHTLCESNHLALEKLLEAFENKFGKFLPLLKWVNIGGGHLITHKDYDVEYATKVLNKFAEKYPWLTIYMEPSAAYVWQTGVLLAEVEDIVERGGVKTAVLNVSFTAHMPDCLEMPYKPKVLGESENGKYVYRFGGNSCLAGDFIDGFRFDNPLNVGDMVVFCDMVHYTTVKTTFFNGVKHPVIGLRTKGGGFELFKVFGYDDYKNKLS